MLRRPVACMPHRCCFGGAHQHLLPPRLSTLCAQPTQLPRGVRTARPFSFPCRQSPHSECDTMAHMEAQSTIRLLLVVLLVLLCYDRIRCRRRAASDAVTDRGPPAEPSRTKRHSRWPRAPFLIQRQYGWATLRSPASQSRNNPASLVVGRSGCAQGWS